MELELQTVRVPPPQHTPIIFNAEIQSEPALASTAETSVDPKPPVEKKHVQIGGSVPATPSPLHPEGKPLKSALKRPASEFDLNVR